MCRASSQMHATQRKQLIAAHAGSATRQGSMAIGVIGGNDVGGVWDIRRLPSPPAAI